MRLTSEPKPVKIRIVSGGEEHSSLDSLLHCFNLPDLQKVEKQLLQWLMRQGEQGNRIADELSRFPDFAATSTIEDYFKIYCFFFPKLIEENNIHSLFQLLKFWYGKTEYAKNAQFIIKFAFEKDEEITMFCYEHHVEGLTNDWMNVLKRIPSAKHIVEDVLQTKKTEFQKIVVANRKKLYPKVEYSEWMRWITDYWDHGETPGWGWEWHLFDYDKRQQEIELKQFINQCKSIFRNGYSLSFYQIKSKLLPNIHDADFENQDCYYKQLEVDYLFCAKVFILLLFDIYRKRDNLKEWKRELVKVYLPAAYMLKQKKCAVLESSNFSGKSFEHQVYFFVCDHLFEF